MTFMTDGRITGLDPSGPLFHSAPPSKRLDAGRRFTYNVRIKYPTKRLREFAVK